MGEWAAVNVPSADLRASVPPPVTSESNLAAATALHIGAMHFAGSMADAHVEYLGTDTTR